MKKLFRRLLFGAALAWGFKMFQDKKTEWSLRPAADIRRDVMSKLPEAMDAETRLKVADKVVETVKGPHAVDAEESIPPTE